MGYLKLGLAVGLFSMALQAKAYSVPESTISVRDMNAIFSDQNLTMQIGTSPIQSVTSEGNELYLITTASCSVEVQLKDTASSPFFIGNGAYKPAVDAYKNNTCRNQ